jgi:uncharacterized membrane protein
MKNNIRLLALTALFVALILLLGYTPLGLIPLGIVNVTILAIPVIIGTIVLGLKSGLVLGLSFGLISTISMITTPKSLLATTLYAANPFFGIVMSMLPRLLIPIVTFLVFRALSGVTRRKIALPVAAVAGSVTNTVFYLGLMLLFYRQIGFGNEVVRGALATRDILSFDMLLRFVAGLAASAGIAEAVVSAVLTTPIVMALWKIEQKAE